MPEMNNMPPPPPMSVSDSGSIAGDPDSGSSALPDGPLTAVGAGVGTGADGDANGDEEGGLEEAGKLFKLGATAETPGEKVAVRARAIKILEGALAAGRVKAAAMDQARQILEKAKAKQADEARAVEELGWPAPPLLVAFTERLEAVGATETHGIFREAGHTAVVDELQGQLFPLDGIDVGRATAEEVLVTVTDPHIVAGLLTRWVRVRRVIRLPPMQHTLFERIGKADFESAPMLVVQLMAALKRSAPATRSVLEHIRGFVAKLDAEKTEMTAHNLGACPCARTFLLCM